MYTLKTKILLVCAILLCVGLVSVYVAQAAAQPAAQEEVILSSGAGSDQQAIPAPAASMPEGLSISNWDHLPEFTGYPEYKANQAVYHNRAGDRFCCKKVHGRMYGVK